MAISKFTPSTHIAATGITHADGSKSLTVRPGDKVRYIPQGKTIRNKAEANNQLRYALNELRALSTGKDMPSDRDTLPERLRALAEYLENPNCLPPDAEAIILEATRIPVQE